MTGIVSHALFSDLKVSPEPAGPLEYKTSGWN